MSVTVRNAAVAKGDATLATAQFVVAGPLGENDKVYILSKLMMEASVALELPTEGREASEIIYRLADERAGVAELTPDPAPALAGPESKPAPGWRRIDWRLAALVAAGLVVGMSLSGVVGALVRLLGAS